MKKLKLLLYYTFFYYLPSTWMPGGKISTRLRLWALKAFIKIGKGTRIQKGLYVGPGNNVIIGNNCQINEKVRLDNVTIGNNVMIARECIVLGKLHNMETTEIPMTDQGRFVPEKTVIDDDVWLGLRVIVLPGVRIKKGTIIGAGAVVSKDTESNSVYGGVPAKKIRDRANE